MTQADLKEIFRYHAPDPESFEKYERIRQAALALSEVILENAPNCADRTAAIRKVREAVMTANAAIALKGAV